MRDAHKLAGVVVTVCLAGCAPAAEPIEGPVGGAVRRALESGAARFDSSDWGVMLAGGTRQGLVDYAYFEARRPELDAYLDRVARQDLASLAPAHLEAMLANAYNALTIRSILEHPDVGSIREIPGVWKETTHRVGGYDLTLDQLEHEILRPFFRDPRIHFAVNCASISCAPLPSWSFEGDDLDEQLERRKSVFLADPANVRVENGTLMLSKYFDWYGPDFTAEGWSGSAPTVVAYVAGGAVPEVKQFIERHGGDPPVRFIDYDWSLNQASEE